ncbi:class I SAM-dependent methyltransferase [Thermoanaerobacterium sp. RBIITD]|uniref:class I SAM-dependent methyltransferase n=1 Tax=Thermoanaerobacterium sp. RBIITD TaxID=1550240 RepID=UPI000BB860CE|nr:class I SAM-dependent methyltransferase [Thermoanaerobacterium sp. RBIITD]SNX54460.1 Ubiquinone/menaquinone biosynthesis C-methylase UbiE [Thermoanaerobacterium sp. RBIITD]
MYNPEQIKNFYNNYGMREWERFNLTAYDRINYLLHMHFLQGHIGKGKKVLDAGCGAGRFSIAIAQSGSEVTLLDISDEQINIARNKILESALSGRVSNFIVGDLCEMSMIEDETFDTTVCYGVALNYLFDNLSKGVSELVRVTKRGGTILISVNSKWGVIHSLLGKENFDILDFFGRPDYWYIDKVVDTGDLPQHPGVSHPPRHFFDAEELMGVLQKAGLKDIALGSSPCLTAGFSSKVELLEKDDKAWETIIRLEEKSHCLPTMLDYGEFLLAKGVREYLI